MVENYQERKEARIERYENLAKKNMRNAEQTLNQAHKMADVIPFGQPILVGHHSEKRDRNYRNRIDKKYESAFKHHDKVSYYQEKAIAAKNNKAISSDDPDAIEKLKTKLEKLQKTQEFMKACNKIVKSKKSTYTMDQRISDLIDLGLKEETAKKLFEKDFAGRPGFASYQLTNNNANMKRIKDRIKQLEKQQNDQTTKIMIGEIEIIDNVEENRIQVFFPDIPDESIRKQLKGYGFRWSRYNGCWQSYRGDHYIMKAKNIISSISEVCGSIRKGICPVRAEV